MERSNYFEELVVSYLSNNLDEEEEEYIINWINSSEQNKQYFEELKRTWSALSVKGIDVDKGWARFNQSKNSDTSSEKKTVKNDSEVVLDNSVNSLDRKVKRVQLTMPAAVAASILLAIILVANFNNKTKITEPIASTGVREIKVEPRNVEYQFNASGEAKKIVLTDGSEVKLHVNSSISYYKPFVDNKREVVLSGKADFKVAKDKLRPFTVLGGGISTTALGTIFSVTAFKDSEKVTVRLFEGKVIVKSSDNILKNFSQNYLLLPGQEFIYDKQNSFPVVRLFKRNGEIPVKNSTREEKLLITAKDTPSIPKVGKENWYMFNNQPLHDVFDQLEKMFNTEIVYKKKDMPQIYLVAKFNVSDSLGEILKQIGLMAKLKVSKKNNSFIISK